MYSSFWGPPPRRVPLPVHLTTEQYCQWEELLKQYPRLVHWGYRRGIVMGFLSIVSAVAVGLALHFLSVDGGYMIFGSVMAAGIVTVICHKAAQGRLDREYATLCAAKRKILAAHGVTCDLKLVADSLDQWERCDLVNYRYVVTKAL